MESGVEDGGEADAGRASQARHTDALSRNKATSPGQGSMFCKTCPQTENMMTEMLLHNR